MIDRLKKVTDVFFHESCPDGTASAVICAFAFHALEMKPKFHSLQYGTNFMARLEPRPGQLFVDITPPKDRWEDWKSVSPLVLDHHETVKHVTEGLDGVYATNDAHSGARIAFEQVFLPVHRSVLGGAFSPPQYSQCEKLSYLAMIRDTWKKDHADWRPASAVAHALLFEGAKGLVEKGLAHGVSSLDMDYLLNIGHKILESNDRRIEKVSKSAFLQQFTVHGQTFNCSFFNSTEKLISEICNHIIDNGGDVSIGYFYLTEEGFTRVSVSVRTNGRVSARKVAEEFPPGGGHERAAGFRMDDGDKVSPRDIRNTVFGAIEKVLQKPTDTDEFLEKLK